MRSLKPHLMLYFCIFSLSCYGQDYKFTKEDYYKSESNFEPAISEKYFTGRNLIYDCYEKHFVCASDVNYEECSESRKNAIANRNVLLPCAPLKQLPNQIECFKLNYTLIHEQTYKGFCISQKKLD